MLSLGIELNSRCILKKCVVQGRIMCRDELNGFVSKQFSKIFEMLVVIHAKKSGQLLWGPKL